MGSCGLDFAAPILVYRRYAGVPVASRLRPINLPGLRFSFSILSWTFCNPLFRPPQRLAFSPSCRTAPKKLCVLTKDWLPRSTNLYSMVSFPFLTRYPPSLMYMFMSVLHKNLVGYEDKLIVPDEVNYRQDLQSKHVSSSQTFSNPDTTCSGNISVRVRRRRMPTYAVSSQGA